MCTDKYIHITCRQSFYDRFCLSCRTGTTQVLHPTRQIFQTLFKRLEMLVSQHGGRYQNRYLFIVRHSFKSSTNCHFCFTKPHVSTNQTIHRTVTFHIRFYIRRCFTLVWCIFVNKRCFQFPLQETIHTELKTFFLTTLRIQFYEVTGNILNFGLSTLFKFLPSSRTQFIQTGSLTIFSFIL